MTGKNVVLIVDDAEVDRITLKKILCETYEILEASNGREALEILKKKRERISAIVLDLVMPGFSGYDFLKVYHNSEEYKNVPVIIATADNDPMAEVACLELGAWDFVLKPYNPRILHFRIKNVIDRSQLEISKELRYRAEFDVLTDIYNKQMYFQKTRELLENYPKGKYAVLCLDIDRFNLINTFFGLEEGDKLLKYIGELLKKYADGHEKVTYGRIEGDVFGICMAYSRKNEISAFINLIRKEINEYPLDFEIESSVGIYLVTDKDSNVSEMHDKASMAAKYCKGMYIKCFEYYAEEMSEKIIREQIIVNNMKNALEEEQFQLYLQPKYALQTSNLEGAEVLVRWFDPEKGMISPGEFIPVFERNGFIMKLDHYIWDKSCQLIRKWLDEGKKPFPISVNISRVSLYNPNLVASICGLVEKYQIPVELFQLELTESAFTNNEDLICKAMEALQEKGFTILMDDFGSGYSSLNVLKDIEVDVLKIDMKFLADTDKEGRSENILASVVRMAKWLNMPVIAEGVEKKEQVLFLRSLGCEYVQGYYFAKPMPVDEYEALAFNKDTHFVDKAYTIIESTDNLWTTSPQMEILFSNMQQAVAIYEYEKGHVEVIRVNNAYYDLFGYRDLEQYYVERSLDKENYKVLQQAFEQVIKTEEIVNCEVHRKTEYGKYIWVNIALKYVQKVGKKSVVLGTITDNTVQREIDSELRKYRAAISTVESKEDTILVVDDVEINRVSLESIFEKEFHVLQAKNGKEAIEVLEKHHFQVDLILLDLIMPVMDGLEFLQYKKNNEDMAAIPVIIITAEESKEQQIETINMGADDYIIKPFIPEVVTRRVSNVLNSSRRYRELLRDVASSGGEADAVENHLDELTGLLNRYTAAKMIRDSLVASDKLQAMIMIQLEISDTNSVQGDLDELQKSFAEKITKCFRKSDVTSRFTENEFVVFMVQIPSVAFLEKRCESLMKELSEAEQSSGHCVKIFIGATITKDKPYTVTELLGLVVEAKQRATEKKESNYVLFQAY